MKVLITGATGVIGGAICGRLVEAGHEVVTLSRQARPATPSGIRSFRWNPEQELPPAEALDGVDAVIHLAGEPVAGGRWTPELKRRIRDSRVLGTRNLVEGMRRQSTPPRVLIGASAVGYYGDRGEEQLDETSAPGRGFLSEVCQDWEHEYRKAADAGIRVAMVRIGVVLSPTGGALEKMLPPFRLGLGGRLGSGRQWFPWIHLDDIVGLFEFALLNESVHGPLNGVAPEVLTNDQFTHRLARALHRPVFLPVPEFVLRLLTGEMAAVVLASQRVSPRVPIDAGYLFRFPSVENALRDIFRRMSR